MHPCCNKMLKRIRKHTHLLHKTGMFLSFLCLIHCLSMPFIVTLLPYVAKNFISHTTEVILMGGSLLIAVNLLIKDYKIHHNKKPVILMIIASILQISGFFLLPENFETPFVVTGSLLLAWAYVSNWQMHQKSCSNHSH